MLVLLYVSMIWNELKELLSRICRNWTTCSGGRRTALRKDELVFQFCCNYLSENNNVSVCLKGCSQCKVLSRSNQSPGVFSDHSTILLSVSLGTAAVKALSVLKLSLSHSIGGSTSCCVKGLWMDEKKPTELSLEFFSAGNCHRNEVIRLVLHLAKL